MFPGRQVRGRGSGLILALGILALLAVMATTFIALMRINTRLSRVYTDELVTEMLASGVANYCLSVLKDDQDRTLYKYENRDQAIGGGSRNSDRMSLRGRSTDWWAPGGHRYGTPASNDVWMHSASEGYVESGLYGVAGHYEGQQASFGGGGNDFCIVDRNDHIVLDPADQNQTERYYAYVAGNRNGLDDDRDGITDPDYVYGIYNGELYALQDYHYDQTYFLTYGWTCYLHPGGKLSGTHRLVGGPAWRWSAKMGVLEERYLNLNAIGNNERLVGLARLNNLDGRGLHAVNGDASVASNHLGLLAWKGYPNEYHYELGFPKKFNAVQYSPYQLDPCRLLTLDFQDFGGDEQFGNSKVLELTDVRPMAEEWVRRRWGADSLPADGGDRWRIGWRRDGATYCKLPSPDNPMGDDHYFGASEALNHQNEDIVPGTSRVFATMLEAAGGDFDAARYTFGRARAFLSTHGCDTILRGKIWPGEGYAYPGDWRHIDILRKININMLGAKGGENLPGEDGALKAQWAAGRLQEQRRLYYMVKAMLDWSGTPSASHEA
ncbi:MAG TPA: hypothetical protein VMZ92_04255, partial [Planctomycetota bacterium]|nr:hypothetical protein [Planctomycetota bacterium]